MTNDPNDLVRVAGGDLVRIELYQRALADAGIESRVVGEELAAGLGAIIPGEVELWARRADADRAAAAIARVESERDRDPHQRPPNGRPTSDPKPGRPPAHGPHPHLQSGPPVVMAVPAGAARSGPRITPPRRPARTRRTG